MYLEAQNFHILRQKLHKVQSYAQNSNPAGLLVSILIENTISQEKTKQDMPKLK